MMPFFEIGVFNFALAVLAYYLYVLVTLFILLLDDREPMATYGWLFLMSAFPILGLLFYWLFGRSFEAKDKRNLEYHRQQKNLISKILRPQPTNLIKLKRLTQDLPYQKEFLRYLENDPESVLTLDNQVEILQNGSVMFPRLLADLRQAKKFIHLEYFIWAEDELTRKIQKILIQKAQEGVEVRILFDAVGSFRTMSQEYQSQMKQAGIQLQTYSDFWVTYVLHTVNYRDHRKITVIDGQIGYLGGMNMTEDYLTGGRHFPSWRDTHSRLQGPIVNILQALFATSWYGQTQEKLGPDYLARESLEKTELMDKHNSELHQNQSRLEWPEGGLEGYLDHKKTRTSNTNLVLKQTTARSNIPIQTTISGPDSSFESIRRLFFLMITSAKDHIYLQSPFLVPDQAIS